MKEYILIFILTSITIVAGGGEDNNYDWQGNDEQQQPVEKGYGELFQEFCDQLIEPYRTMIEFNGVEDTPSATPLLPPASPSMPRSPLFACLTRPAQEMVRNFIAARAQTIENLLLAPNMPAIESQQQQLIPENMSIVTSSENSSNLLDISNLSEDQRITLMQRHSQFFSQK